MTGTVAVPPRHPQPTIPEAPSPVRRLWPWLAAVASGVLLALCFPPYDQGWLVWVALTPLICALWFSGDQKHSIRRPLLLGYTTGTIFFTMVFSWLSNLGTLFQSPLLHGLPLLLSLVLGLYIAIWAWFVAKLRSKEPNAFRSSRQNLAIGFLAACAWVIQEWVRGWLFSGFGWNGLGVALYRNLPMIQIADLAGVLGISWLVAYCNVMAVVIIRRIIGDLGLTFLKKIRWEFSISMALVAIVFIYGIHALFRPPAANHVPLKVALLQPNIPQDEKWSRESEDAILENLKKLTARVANHPSEIDEEKLKAILDPVRSGERKQVSIPMASLKAVRPDLVVWPESATPRGMFADEFSFRFVVDQVRDGDFSLLLGTILTDEAEEADFNAAALVTEKGQSIQLYRKIHLVPFGEYLPMRPILRPIAGKLVPGDFTPGKEPKVMRLSSPNVQIGAVICFEDTLGDLCRRFVGNGAQVLINVTNDGWFLHSAAAEQHFHNALFRAVENRRPLLRCANTGITGAVDPAGRLDRWAEPFTSAAIAKEVSIPSGNLPFTLYTRYGDWLAYLSCAVILLWLAVRINRPGFHPGGPSDKSAAAHS